MLDFQDSVKAGRLQVKIWGNETNTIYNFSGDVDERFQWDKIPLRKTPVVTFRLSEIRSFNSSGVRAWVHWMEQMRHGCRLVLEECSVVFVDQMNTLADVGGTGKIVSFFAPYYCSGCRKEVNHLIVCDIHRASLQNLQAPQVVHTCGTPLEFDALEDSYLQHISQKLLEIGPSTL